MGTPAKSNLRELRKKAHLKFDYIRKKENTSRNQACLWLCQKLNCSICECHIGYFDETMCIRVLEILDGFIGGNNSHYPEDSFGIIRVSYRLTDNIHS
jgi:hypothetical protein